MSDATPAKFNILCHTYKDRNKKTLTDMSIRMGNTTIATRTSAGNWSEDYTLTEVRRFPDRFKLKEGWTLDQLKALIPTVPTKA